MNWDRQHLLWYPDRQRRAFQSTLGSRSRFAQAGLEAGAFPTGSGGLPTTPYFCSSNNYLQVPSKPGKRSWVGVGGSLG